MKAVYGCLSFAVMFVASHATTPLNTSLIDEYVERVRAQVGIPAVSVAVIQLDANDQVVQKYTQGYGYLHPTCQGSQCPKVNETTKFCIGSCTKAFTGSMLGEVLKGNSAFNQTVWDTPIVRLLPAPSANFFDDESIYTKITVRDLLSHRMGIGRHDGAWFFGSPLSRSQLLSKLYTLYPIGPLEKVWRSSSEYNNWIVSLAGHIAELQTGKLWEDLIQEFYFDPLGMTNSQFYHRDYESGTNFARTAITTPSGWNESVPVGFPNRMQATAAAGTICTDAIDMTKYLSFLLKEKGTTVDKISRSTIADAMTGSNAWLPPTVMSLPQSKIGSSMDTYGFGWWQGLYRGYTRQEHAGGVDGFLSNLILLPTVKAGVFVSTTNDIFDLGNSGATDISYFIADQVLGLQPWLNNDDQVRLLHTNPPRKSITAVGTPECALSVQIYSKFVGTFVHPMFGYANVSWYDASGRLYIEYGTYGHAALCHWPEMSADTNTLYMSEFLSEFFETAMTGPYGQQLLPLLSITFNVDNNTGEATSIAFKAIQTVGAPIFVKTISESTTSAGTFSSTKTSAGTFSSTKNPTSSVDAPPKASTRWIVLVGMLLLFVCC